jgi:hypothetical protein
MEQRKMIDIPIGTTVRSSSRSPIDGVYEFVEHVASSDCKPSGADVSLYLHRGELMPFCKKCGKRGIWKLTESKFEIKPEEDHTEYALKVVRGDRPDIPYPSGTKR